MNKKNFMDMMICSLSAAIIILCFTYMEQSRGRDTLMAVCGIVFLAFLLLAVTDSLSGRQKKRGNGRGIQELLLLDEEGNEISAWHIGGKTSLLIGRDIEEPTGEAFTDYTQIDFAIIPGVSFDKNGNRLGRGKGYYDRLLPQLHSYNVGICFDFQVSDEIPTESFDKPMHEVWTEKGKISLHQ